MDLLTFDAWAGAMTARRPFATDDKGHGVYRTDKTTALSKRLLQVNSSRVMGSLTFDIDDDMAELNVLSLALDDEAVPMPSWITTNLDTGHCHVGYLVGEPITKTPEAREHPIRYAAAIERTITERLGADRGYSGLLTRNPQHKGHVTRWGPSKPYTLGELHKPLGKLDPKPSKLIREVGVGRNVSLFDHTRDFSYTAFSRHDSYEKFAKAVEAHALSTNAVSFEAPLSVAEARRVARSVANWTWRTFTYNKTTDRYSQTQRNRAMRRAAYLSKQNAVKAIQEFAADGHELTAQEIMDNFGVSLRTARAYRKEAGLVEHVELEDRSAEVAALRAQGLSYGQIQDRMGLSVSQVRYALRKAHGAY